MKKAISLLLAVILLILGCPVYAQEEQTLTPHADNVYNAGVSLVFLYDSAAFSPDTVLVNGQPVAEEQFVIHPGTGKLYVFGSVFSEAGPYTVQLTDGEQTAECSVTMGSNTETIEYTTEDTAAFTYGPLVDPSQRAGREHTALGNQGTRQPVIVRNITADQLEDLWIQWPITQKGSYVMDYWCPKAYVAAPVTVEVQDAEGRHTFNGILGNPDDGRYVSLGGAEQMVFTFRGDGSEYLLVRPEEATVNFIVDSFRMTSVPVEHNTSAPRLESEMYGIADNTITGVLYKTAVEDFLKGFWVPFDCAVEIDSQDGAVEPGDILRVYKLFDKTIMAAYTIGPVQYILPRAYTVDEAQKQIKNIPYGEPKDVFLNNIDHNTAITLKIFTGDTQSTADTILDGDTLKVYVEGREADAFSLSCLAPSSDTALTSRVYSIVDNVITVPYGELADVFFQNITVPEFAKLSHPFADGSTQAITEGFSMTVTAQDGTQADYAVQVEIGDNAVSELESAVYTISDQRVAGVEPGTLVSDFLSAVTATNGGTIKIFDSTMKEKTTGVLAGGETVRVYPRYRFAGNDYFPYAIDFIPAYRQDGEPIVVWACENNEKNETGYTEFSGDNFVDGNTFATKRVGYDGTNAHRADNPQFTLIVRESGVYNVQFFTTAGTEGVDETYTLTVQKNGTDVQKTTATVKNSQLTDLGSYPLAAGETLTVLPKNDKITFISAVLFTPMAAYEAMLEQTTALADGRYAFSIDFNFDVDPATLPDGIAVCSENGNRMPVELDLTTGIEAVSMYPFEPGVRYQLVLDQKIRKIAGETLPGVYVFPIDPVKEETQCTARVQYFKGDDSADGIQTADTVLVKLEISAAQPQEITVYAIQYRGAFMAALDRQTYTPDEAGKILAEQTHTVAAGADKLAVFAVGPNGNLLTNTYYVDR